MGPSWRRRGSRWRPAVLGLLLAEGCGGGGGGAAADPGFRVPQPSIGHLRMAGGSLRFTPCDSGEGRTIEDDATGSGAAVLQELGGGGSDPGIPVMLRLEETRLREVRYAAPEGAGCERLPPEGELEARGNEPFWHLRVDGPRAWFRTPETPDGVEFAGGGWSRPTPGRWVYQAERRSEAGAERLTLELSAERCKDGMSGAWYPYAAAMMRGGTRLEGCALEGRKAFTDLPP